MKRALTPLQYTALSLFAFILLLAAIYFLLLQPVWSYRQELSGELEQLQSRHQRFTRTAQSIDSIREDIRQLRQDQSDSQGFLQETIPDLAAAALQSMIAERVQQAGGTVVSTQKVDNHGSDMFPRITVKVQLRATIESLQRLLFALESDETVLTLDNLQILQRANRSIASRRRNVSGTQPEDDWLDVVFEVSGFIYQTAGADT